MSHKSEARKVKEKRRTGISPLLPISIEVYFMSPFNKSTLKVFRIYFGAETSNCFFLPPSLEISVPGRNKKFLPFQGWNLGSLCDSDSAPEPEWKDCSFKRIAYNKCACFSLTETFIKQENATVMKRNFQCSYKCILQMAKHFVNHVTFLLIYLQSFQRSFYCL